MLDPLTRTKLHLPPPQGEMVPRPQLMQALDSSLHRSNGFLLVSAPAGFGKTTLVAEWLRRQKMPAAWLSLDKEDNEPARFWRYVLAAVQSVHASAGSAALAALDAPSLPPVENLITSLLNDLAALEQQLILVLDDYHVIEDVSIHAGLNFLLEHMPTGLWVTVITRADPPLSLSRRRGRAQITETRTADLRFSLAEASVFLNKIHRLQLSEKEISVLENRTEGWIVGLQLAAMSLRRQADRHAFVSAFAGDDRYVADYLLEEVLSQQPQEVQTFLLKTSLLDRLCGPLCEYVTEIPGAGKLLDYLEENNLFLLPLDNNRRWFRYHSLFADLLRRRMGQTYSAGERAKLYRRSAFWYEREGLPVEAIAQALALPDHHLAADLLERHVLTIFFRSETMLVDNWLKRLPEAELRARPLLSAMYANTIAHISGIPTNNLKPSEQWLQTAEQTLAEQTARDPSCGAEEQHSRKLARSLIALSHAYLALWRNDPPPLVLSLAKRALEGLPSADQADADPNFLRIRSGLYYNLGLSHLAVGETEQADRAFARARSIGMEYGDLLNTCAAAGAQSLILRNKGRLQEAHDLCREVLDNLGRVAGTIPYAGILHITLGQILLEWNRLNEAEPELALGLNLSALTASAEMQLWGGVAMAYLQQARGDAAAATAAIRQLAHKVPSAKSLAVVYRARLAVMQNDIRYALQWAQGRNLSDGPPEEGLTLVRLVLGLRRTGVRPKGASSLPAVESLPDHLDEACRAAENAGRIDRRIEISMLKALTMDLLDRSDEAEESLRNALSLAQAGGYIRLFLAEGKPLLLLLERLQRTDREHASYIGRLLAAAKWIPSGPTVAAQALIEPLSPRESEILHLLAAGRTNAQIAQQLVITLNTTKKHITHILAKLNASNRTEAVAHARKLNLLP